MRSRLGMLAFAAVVLLIALPALAQSKMGVQKLADGVWAAQLERGANVGWFLYGDGVVAIDSGIDVATANEILKEIAESTGGKPVRYLILTHAHADHIFGLDDVRIFNWRTKQSMPIYGSRQTLDEGRDRFIYVFQTTQEGGGKPKLDLIPVDSPFEVAGLHIIPLDVLHGGLTVADLPA